ncbi:glutathione-specific gamma-glutamylcyclotransferase 1-like [Stigmatopora nigra]
MKPQEIFKQKGNLWVFGYGSLVWKPDFKYQNCKIGYIKGYKRRFWQGDDYYRGDKDNLGRIATLVEDQQACTWGVAYEIPEAEKEKAFEYLNMREVEVGGYITEMLEFFPRESGEDTVHALVYTGTTDHPTYVGPASYQEIADQIAICSGKTGHNVEYLLKLAEFMHHHCPEVKDDHLFGIEEALFNILENSKKGSQRMCG